MMFRSMRVGVVCFGLMSAGVASGYAFAQPAPSMEAYFTGRQVVMKVDMPGSQKGVDLKYNKPSPMDWNDYSSRLRTDGVSLHKGQVARITKFVVKNDMIEFQLDGGGYGVAGDDTMTTVSAAVLPKSQYEKDLEKQISTTADARKKHDLEQDLDRERAKRARMDVQAQAEANVASQMKAQQVAERRLHGGSRFNLRWQGSIPSDTRNPEAVMALLAEYVDFDPAHVGAGAPASSYAPAQPAGPPAGYPPPAAAGYPPPAYGTPADGGANALKRGMRVDEVTALMGQGRMVSTTVSNEGLKTQVIEYRTADSLVGVTFVEGVVVRYSINSR